MIKNDLCLARESPMTIGFIYPHVKEWKKSVLKIFNGLFTGYVRLICKLTEHDSLSI